jgi:signal transduction histidine kinase
MQRDRLRLGPFDAVVVLVFLIAETLAIVRPEDGSRVAQIVLPAFWTLPLLARGRAPVAATLTVLGALALESKVAHPVTESTTVLPVVLGAFWVAGTIGDRAAALATGAAGLLMTGSVIADNAGAVDASDVFFAAVFTIGPFAGGVVAGARARRVDEMERTREQQARVAVADERARIARELHDVVGHAISVMTVQAGAARLVFADDPDRARTALLAVEEAGRDALGEMRRMLSVLREETDADDGFDPQPGLGDLEHLVGRNREAGLDVCVDVAGDRRSVSSGVELTVYRIVQEALTNVRKHAGTARAEVRICFENDALVVVIENDGDRVREGRANGGHGLVGMHERVALYDGELEVGPRAEGGFAVRARLPRTTGSS